MDEDEILGPSALLAQGPVSMQAVGQPNLSSSLLGALDSPRIPDEAILGLMQQGPSFGQRMGQALAGGVAAMRGQANPVNAILQGQQQERIGLATMLQRMNAQADLKDHRQSLINIKKQEMDEKRSAREQATLKGAVDMSMSILNNPNASDTAVVIAQDNLRQFAPKLYKGFQVPEAIIQRKATQEDLKSAMTDVFLNSVKGPDGKYMIPPEGIATVAQRHPRFKPEELPGLADSLNRPDVQKFMGMKTTAELEKEQLDLMEKRWKVTAEMATPYEWSKDPTNLRGLMDLSRKMYPGIDPLNLSSEQRSSVSRTYDQEKRQQKQDDFEARADIKLQHGLQMLGTRIDAQVAAANAKQNLPQLTKPVPQGQQLKELNHYRGLKSVYDTLEDLQQNAIEVPKEMWPASGNPAARSVATFKRWINGGEDKVFAMKTKMLGTISGMIERGILNDKGARALQTMKAELEAADSWPTYKAFKTYIDKYQTLLRNQVAEGVSELEDSGVNAPEVLKGAKGVLRRMGPQGSADKRSEPTPPRQRTPVRVWLRNTVTGMRQEAEFVPGIDEIPAGWVLEK